MLGPELGTLPALFVSTLAFLPPLTMLSLGRRDLVLRGTEAVQEGKAKQPRSPITYLMHGSEVMSASEDLRRDWKLVLLYQTCCRGRSVELRLLMSMPALPFHGKKKPRKSTHEPFPLHRTRPHGNTHAPSNLTTLLKVPATKGCSLHFDFWSLPGLEPPCSTSLPRFCMSWEDTLPLGHKRPHKTSIRYATPRSRHA